jgi:hypothetical protein
MGDGLNNWNYNAKGGLYNVNENTFNIWFKSQLIYLEQFHNLSDNGCSNVLYKDSENR